MKRRSMRVRRKTGTGAAHVEIRFFPRCRERGGSWLPIAAEATLHDLQAWISLGEQFTRAMAELGRPQRHFRFWKILFQQAQCPGCMTDVANVHALPRAAQQNARRAPGSRRRERRNSRQAGSSAGHARAEEELATIHG